MSEDGFVLDRIREVNATAGFNRFFDFTVESASQGCAVLSMSWRPEAGQYSGFLHAGVLGALIDTACGYAAATVVGPSILASHFSVNCLRPALGSRFIARARVVKPGRQQVFAACEVFAVSNGAELLVSTGETLLSLIEPAEGR